MSTGVNVDPEPPPPQQSQSQPSAATNGGGGYTAFWNGVRSLVGIYTHTKVAGHAAHEKAAQRRGHAQVGALNEPFDEWLHNDAGGDLLDSHGNHYEMVTEVDVLKMKELRLFNPEGPRMNVWNVVMGLAVLYTAAYIPFRIAFMSTVPESDSLAAAGWFVTVLFMVDIGVNFNTAYIDWSVEKLIIDRREVAWRYLTFWFPIDVVSTLPFDKIVTDGQTQNVRLIRALRLVRVVKLFKLLGSEKLQEALEDAGINPQIVGVVILIFQLLFVGHLVACGWYFMTNAAVTQYDDTTVNSKFTTWATTFGFTPDVSTTYDAYVASMYYTFATLLTIGASPHISMVPLMICCRCGSCVDPDSLPRASVLAFLSCHRLR